ncbi:MAG: efflux RND transporter permease subunit [Sphaerotilus natans]
MCRWARTPGAPRLDGTAEIGLAVLATTLSIVAVFLPIGFMGGIIGQFFHEFGITIVAAVLISMFVSFTLDPTLSARSGMTRRCRPRDSLAGHALRAHAGADHPCGRPWLALAGRGLSGAAGLVAAPPAGRRCWHWARWWRRWR